MAVWDNRVCAHVGLTDVLSQGSSLTVLQTAILDFHLDPAARRHGVRITPQAERPIPALDGLELE